MGLVGSAVDKGWTESIVAIINFPTTDFVDPQKSLKFVTPLTPTQVIKSRALKLKINYSAKPPHRRRQHRLRRAKKSLLAAVLLMNYLKSKIRTVRA